MKYCEAPFVICERKSFMKVVLKVDLSEAALVDAALHAIGRICDVLIGLNIAYLVQLSARYLS